MAISSVTSTQVNAYTSSMALGLLQTGVSADSGAALLGISGTSSSSTYGADDLFGLNTGSSYVSLAADTFASVLTSQSESMVTQSIQQATARIKAEATAKLNQAQDSASVAKGISV